MAEPDSDERGLCLTRSLRNSPHLILTRTELFSTRSVTPGVLDSVSATPCLCKARLLPHLSARHIHFLTCYLPDSVSVSQHWLRKECAWLDMGLAVGLSIRLKVCGLALMGKGSALQGSPGIAFTG
ncbi:hypothetical protein L798_07530 [Zootermopsis nevadensis]|uniref:Uncharacterized protein n=1 Tax=Zootermopsis nevadensis TaxID=136037 RepID=A0A067R6V7_ZOONE|nr:hypothetical protein L798_07530 [Zootermopsis nevadensis]